MLPSGGHRRSDSLRCGKSARGARESSRCAISTPAVQVDTLAVFRVHSSFLCEKKVTDASRLPQCRKKL